MNPEILMYYDVTEYKRNEQGCLKNIFFNTNLI